MAGPDDVVQPETAVDGQGAEATPQGGIFDPYLAEVPEDAREYVTGYLRDAEKNVNSRFSEAAELQKTYSPFQQVEGLESYTPEQLSELLAWHQQITADDNTYQDWLREAAQEAGLTLAQAEEAVETAIEDGEVTPDQIQQLVAQQSAEQIQPLVDRFDAWEEQRMVDGLEAEIRDGWRQLESEHQINLTDEQKALIIDLGLNHEGENWIEYGFSRLQHMWSEGQKAFVADKAAQPKPTLPRGGQEAFKPTTDWSEASKQALNLLQSKFQ